MEPTTLETEGYQPITEPLMEVPRNQSTGDGIQVKATKLPIESRLHTTGLDVIPMDAVGVTD